jgi:MYXO-CTERM domain-containing protein
LKIHQSDAQRRTGMLGPKRQIANDTRAVNAAANHQDVQQTGGPQSLNLIAAQVRHLSSSLAGESACTPWRGRDIIRELTRKPLLLFYGPLSLLFAGLLIYSVTAAVAWDEGFHLLAAQLIKDGKRPYLDFLFPQTALNAYWVAMWMRVFGDSWRMVHALAATMTAGAIVLTGDYVLRRFPVPNWRVPAAVAAALATGLNAPVFQFGSIGQAYGLGLFLVVAAFRISILSVERTAVWWSALAGLAAGAGAGSTLLTAPVGPVLLLWIVIQSRTGKRWVKSALFVMGELFAFLPLLRLYIESPRVVRFNIIDYHLFFRQLEWEGAIQHDVGVLISWIDSTPAALLGLLALAGLLFIARRSDWDRQLRAEFYLCGWLTLALSIHLSTAHPTFSRYFLFTTPFLAILASVGLYDICSRLLSPDRPWPPVIFLAVLSSLGVAKAIYDGRDNMHWHDFQQIAQKVQEVTPPGQPIMADEFVYFLLKRVPPSGMELEDSHKLNNLPAGLAAALHVVPRNDLEKQVKQGKFSTVETCDDDDERIEAFKLTERYSRWQDVSGCVVYWSLRPSVTAPKK